MQNSPSMPAAELDSAQGKLVDLVPLPASVLAQQHAEETSKLLQHLPSSDLPGMALFHKAIAQRDEAAWTALYQQYAPLLLTWIAQSTRHTPLLLKDEGASLVNAAFAKFFRAVTPQKLSHFARLA